jgi:hypothetical protein
MGVDAWDDSQKRTRKFTLHVIVMWLVHNLCTYRLLSRKVIKTYKGYKACPNYGLNMFLSFMHLLLSL